MALIGCCEQPVILKIFYVCHVVTSDLELGGLTMENLQVLEILATCSDVCLINSVSQTTEGLADFIAVYYLLVS